jgi:signal transduction histidine kinase/DNA-binding response OmpR family regulator/ligand-binding sensor domain-containing protein
MKYKQIKDQYLIYDFLIQIVLVCFFSTGVFNLNGQKYLSQLQFERIGTEQGMHSTDVYTIFQDSVGFIWVGTSNGLSKYDGISFIEYRKHNNDTIGLIENFIFQINQNKEGILFVVTQGGYLHYFNNEINDFVKVHVFNEEDDKNEIFIKQILIDNSGKHWIVTKNNVLQILNIENWKATNPFSSQGTLARVNLISFDNKTNTMWAVANKKLYSFLTNEDQYRMIKINQLDSTPLDKVNCLTVDALGKVWIGGFMETIVCYNPSTETLEKIKYKGDANKSGVNEINRVNTIAISKSGLVWIGTNYEGVIVLDTIENKSYRYRFWRENSSSLSSDVITKIIEDKSGIIWISTWEMGLNKYVPQKSQFHHFKSISNDGKTLSHPLVTCMYEDEQNMIWVGTQNGLNYFNHETGDIINYFIPKTIIVGEYNAIYSIQSFNNEELALGTTQGLYLFNKRSKLFSKWKSKNTEEEPVEKEIIYFLIKDNKNQLWVITYFPYQIYKYNTLTQGFELIPFVHELTPTGEPYLTVDNQRNIWITESSHGLFKINIDDVTWTKELPGPTSDYFSSDNLGHFHIDSKGTIWRATLNNLYYWNSTNDEKEYDVNSISEEDGLSGNQVLGILEADNGELWLSTNKGLSHYNILNKQFKNYTVSDGLQGNEFGFGTFLNSPSTKLFYFGGKNGFNVFDPNEISSDSIVPKIVFTKIDIIKDGARKSTLLTPKDISTQKNYLELSHFEKIFNIHFAALHYAAPQKNTYEVFLAGFDNSWRNIGNQSEITYTNLDPGNYNLKIRASNKDGVFNTDPIQMAIKVHPPIWKTWWAYCVYVFSFIAIVIAVYKRNLSRQQEKSEIKRILELDTLKSRLYANITHEFRTPLTVILGMAEEIEKKPDTRLESGLKLIKRNGKNLLSLINQMLDLAKLESKRMKIEYVQGDICVFIKSVAESFQSMADLKDIRFNFEIKKDSILMDYDPSKLNQIISNILSNAVKFTPPGGEIYLIIDKEENGLSNEVDSKLKIIIRDSGIGIGKDQLGHIFDRFYQVDDSNIRKNEGTGIGLALTHELVLFLNGRIVVESEIGTGSEFVVELPITNQAELITSYEAAVSSVIDNGSLKTFLDLEDSIIDSSLHEGPILLLVEDNEDVMAYLISCLEDQFKLLIAENGQKGIEKAFETIPDIIISDVMMPKKDGFQLCEELKNDQRTSHIPIILLTARAAVEDRISGLKRGADVYMSKPFNQDQLKVQIESIISNRNKLQSRFRNLSILEMDAPEEVKIEDAFIIKVRKYIESNLDNSDLTILQLSREMGVSRMQLHRKIKALTGLSTSIYLRSIRLDIALNLIKSNEYSISEIAYKVGFDDPRYFSRVFSEKFGKAPSAFQKKLLN